MCCFYSAPLTCHSLLTWQGLRKEKSEDVGFVMAACVLWPVTCDSLWVRAGFPQNRAQCVGMNQWEIPLWSAHWWNRYWSSFFYDMQWIHCLHVFSGQPMTSAWRSLMMKISLKLQMTVGLDSTMTRIHMRRWGFYIHWSFTLQHCQMHHVCWDSYKSKTVFAEYYGQRFHRQTAHLLSLYVSMGDDFQLHIWLIVTNGKSKKNMTMREKDRVWLIFTVIWSSALLISMWASYIRTSVT